MSIHKEGYRIILVTVSILIALNAIVYSYLPTVWVSLPVMVLSATFLFFVLWFFRNPKRPVVISDTAIFAPADGKIVVIEETLENEYFNDKRLQVSIFMSPLNVHVNRYPVSGKVSYFKYHKGLFLVAWHPKSSTDNERTTVVVKTKTGTEVLFRQIAGAVARRIVAYPKVGDVATQGEDFGFIKFGSRVDLFLPLGTKINVSLNEVVLGNKTIIGYLEK